MAKGVTSKIVCSIRFLNKSLVDLKRFERFVDPDHINGYMITRIPFQKNNENGKIRGRIRRRFVKKYNKKSQILKNSKSIFPPIFPKSLLKLLYVISRLH